MPWQRDDRTGEWVMLDAAPSEASPPTAMPPGSWSASLGPPPRYDPRPYDEGPHEQLPSPPREVPPSGAPSEGYSNPGLAFPRSATPTYRNEDDAALRQWLEQEVWSKGLSADIATGDIIDPDTGEVVGKIPSFARMI